MTSTRIVPVILMTLTGLHLSIDSTGAAEQTVTGNIREVTLYRDQARVVREIEIPASEQLQQVRVTALPSRIVPRTAFTESDAGTNVRGMRIISRSVDVDPEFQQRLEALRKKQADMQQRLNQSEQSARAIDQDLVTLDKLIDFSASKVKQNLDRATLDVQSVTALADFTMERRRNLSAEFLRTETENEQLKRDLDENQKQQEELIAGQRRLNHEAVISCVSPQGGTIRFVYDVSGVNWTPRYSIRAEQNDQGERSFALQLDADLIQDSGEDWGEITLTVSTSSPESQVARPLLTPLRVHAIEAGEPFQSTGQQIAGTYGPQWVEPGRIQNNVELNAVANHQQVTEMTSPAVVQRVIAADAGEDVRDENYRLAEKLTIASHPQLQTISMLSDELTGNMHRVVTPLLSSFAFREAQLTNNSGRNLIAGNIDVYLDGDFVGQTNLPPTAMGQRMTIGFGTDRLIRTRRELLSKQDSVQGGNRSSTLKHRLVISNYHDKPIQVRLLDRIPIAAQDDSIRVSLDPESSQQLSDDKLYVRMQRPTGVLRWDIEVPAKSFGAAAFDHEYSYSIELARQHKIASNDLQQTMNDLRFQKTNIGGGMGGAF